MSATSVFQEIAMERARQEAKWGEQNHDVVLWMPILMEEVGEASTEAIRAHFSVADGGSETDERRAVHLERCRTELVQVAALAVAIIESIDRAAARELAEGTPHA